MSMYFEPTPASAIDNELFRPQHQLGLGDFLGLTIKNIFERNTTLGVAVEESRIRDAEEAAGIYYDMTPNAVDAEGGIASIPDVPVQHPFAMSKVEWEQSQHYRKGIDYTPHMTEPRAQIYAEIFDRRKDEARLLGQSNTGIVRPVLGFGAALLASLPDPINFIPVVGAASRGASIGAKVARGAIEGAVSNVAADAVLFPVVNARGEDFGLYDVAMDAVFGALIGGGIGGIGGFLQKRGTDKFLRDTLQEQNALTRELVEGGLDEKAAHTAARSVFTELSLSNERGEIAMRLRETIGGEDRVNFATAFDRVLSDMVNDKPSDVMRIMENHGIQQKFVDAMQQARTQQIKALEIRLVNALDEGQFTDVNFGRLDTTYKDALNEIRTENGVSLIVDEQLVIPANVVKKLYESRILRDGMSANEVARLLLDVFHGDPALVSTTRHPHIQAIIDLREGLSQMGFIGVNEQTGQTVIKSGYKIKTDRIEKTLSDSGGAHNPSSVDADASAPLAAARLSALQNDANVLHLADSVNEKSKSPADSAQERVATVFGDTRGELSDRPTHGQQGPSAADALETPDTHGQKMPEDVNTVNTDINTQRTEGMATPEAFELDRLQREGLVREEDLITLRDHEAIAQRTESLREDALGIVTCITGVA